MPSVVVDTDVVSFIFKGDTRSDLYLPHLIGNLTIVSFMTIAELDRWALQYNWGVARRLTIESHLQKYVISFALLHQVPLVTHNRSNYVGVDGLTVISEAP